MSKSKCVAITQRIKYDPHYQEYRDELDHRYIDWILASGHVPVPIPNNLISSKSSTTISQWLESFNIQVIVLSGGNNIGEFEKRDNTESFLLSWAKEKRYPVLGICRGMQFMGTQDGTELVEISNHVGVSHSINTNFNGKSSVRKVNSYHNYALKNCPKSYDILAKSDEGYPEAIAHKILPWQAWMWHPERENEFQSWDLKQFQELISNV